MRRFLGHALLTIVLVGLAAGLANRFVAAADGAFDKEYKGFEDWAIKYGVTTGNAPDPSYVKASSSFEEALAKRDMRAVAALLNEKFQWVTSDGEQHTKAQVLENLDAFANNNEGNMDMRTTDFRSEVERVLGLHHNERFVHIWAKGSAGWQAFAYLDIPIPKQRRVDVDPPPRPQNPQSECINPCKTVGDFRPADAAQAEVLKIWMEMKNAEWRPNPELWSSHADVYHETISPNGDVPMLQHAAELSNARRLYGPRGANPGEPVLAMKMFTFGNVVIQQSLQGRGSKPATWVMRLFVNRGDSEHSDWKIALSSQVRMIRSMDAQKSVGD